MLIGGIIGIGIISLIAGEFQWALLIGFVVGISITEIKIRSREKTGEVETDERIEKNSLKFMSITMGISLFLLLIYLVVSDFIFNQSFIEVKHLIYYVLGTFLVTLFIGPPIIKKR